MDDELFICPFDPNHKIRSSRFENHIIKCRKVKIKLITLSQNTLKVKKIKRILLILELKCVHLMLSI